MSICPLLPRLLNMSGRKPNGCRFRVWNWVIAATGQGDMCICPHMQVESTQRPSAC